MRFFFYKVDLAISPVLSPYLPLSLYCERRSKSLVGPPPAAEGHVARIADFVTQHALALALPVTERPARVRGDGDAVLHDSARPRQRTAPRMLCSARASPALVLVGRVTPRTAAIVPRLPRSPAMAKAWKRRRGREEDRRRGGERRRACTVHHRSARRTIVRARQSIYEYADGVLHKSAEVNRGTQTAASRTDGKEAIRGAQPHSSHADGVGSHYTQ